MRHDPDVIPSVARNLAGWRHAARVSLSALVVPALLLLAGCGERAETVEAPLTASQAAPTATATQAVVEVGRPMPPYSVPLLDGSQFEMASERGNVVFLNLWATWCGPCRYEIPELEKLHADLSKQGFKVVGVSVDEGGDQIVRDFVKEEAMNYPVALDPEGRLAVLLDTTILPTSIIVDRAGNVVWKKLGVVTANDQEMLAALESALKAEGPAAPTPAPSADQASRGRRGADRAVAG